MVEEFNVDLKAQCDRLNLAHVARKIFKKKLKRTKKLKLGLCELTK